MQVLFRFFVNTRSCKCIIYIYATSTTNFNTMFNTKINSCPVLIRCWCNTASSDINTSRLVAMFSTFDFAVPWYFNARVFGSSWVLDTHGSRQRRPPCVTFFTPSGCIIVLPLYHESGLLGLYATLTVSDLFFFFFC